MIFSALITGTILTIGGQEIDVVAPHIVLGKVNDRRGQTHFTVMIGGMLRNITNKLGDLGSISKATPTYTLFVP